MLEPARRPVYQTAADLAAEEEAAKIIARLFKCELVKLPNFYPLDRAALRGKVITAFIEIKRRHLKIDERTEVWLSLHKVGNARTLNLTSGKPCFVFFQFDDVLAYADMIGDYKDIRMGGRTDRDDPQDIEPLAIYSTKALRRVTGARGEKDVLSV